MIFKVSGLFSKRTVWKTAGVSVLIAALAVGLFITTSSLSTKAAYAKAVDIVKNSPEVRAALGNVNVQEVKDLKWADKKGRIIFEGTNGKIVTVEIYLEGKKVVTESNFTFTVKVVDAAAAVPDDNEKQEAISIAKTDLRIKELLNQGATLPFGEVERATTIEVKPADTQTGKPVVVNKLQIVMYAQLGDKQWRVIVDPNEKQVVYFLKIPPDISP